MRHAVLDIIPCATVTCMREDIDGWPGSSAPELDIKKYPCWVV